MFDLYIMYIFIGYEKKAKVQTTSKYIQCDVQARTGTKSCSTKQANGKW